MTESISFQEYISRIQIQKPSVVTIGNFDGLHRGHMELIDYTAELARKREMHAVVFSYEVHPKSVLYEKLVHLIIPQEEKQQLLFERGMDTVLFAPFDESLRNQSAEQFCDEVLIGRLNCKVLVMGEDARFGREMATAQHIAEYLKTRGVETILIPLLKINGVRISSSGIRSAIERGDLEAAEEQLGRKFSITGKIIHGKKNGKAMGYPTANLSLVQDQVLPIEGVYETNVYYKDKVYKGATSVGKNPTFGANPLTVETYILDFDENIYGRTIRLEFVRQLRGQITFDSIDALIVQMQEDVKQIRTQQDTCLQSLNLKLGNETGK